MIHYEKCLSCWQYVHLLKCLLESSKTQIQAEKNKLWVIVQLREENIWCFIHIHSKRTLEIPAGGLFVGRPSAVKTSGRMCLISRAVRWDIEDSWGHIMPTILCYQTHRDRHTAVSVRWRSDYLSSVFTSHMLLVAQERWKQSKEIGAGMINKCVQGATARLRSDQVLPKALVIKRKIKAAWCKWKGERADEKCWSRRQDF